MDQLLQEILLEQDPTGWRMLTGCILLNLTHRRQVDGVYPKLFRDYPTAVRMADAPVFHLEHDLMPLGLQHRRAMTLHRFAHWWELAWETGYPGGSMSVLGQVPFPPTLLERVRAMEPPGVGEYARDSWAIFVEGTVPDWPVNDRVLLGWLAGHDPELLRPHGALPRPWEPEEHYNARRLAARDRGER